MGSCFLAAQSHIVQEEVIKDRSVSNAMCIPDWVEGSQKLDKFAMTKARMNFAVLRGTNYSRSTNLC